MVKNILGIIKISYPAFSFILIILFIVVPFPVIAVDIFIGLNLLFAIIILIIVMYSKKASEFSLLPTTILLSTLFTLAINISAVRQILTKGENFDGWFILTFSKLFAGSGDTWQLYVSFVLFIVFAGFMLIIIGKGCTRVAEVAARFVLDSMQVKMMAIETVFSAGEISEEEVQKQKAEVRQEADFFGALDGACKFISGNAKVIILITFIIILGGTLIEIFQNGVEIIDALKTYMYLSIGNGIIFMLPVFIISLAAGITVTRLTKL